MNKKISLAIVSLLIISSVGVISSNSINPSLHNAETTDAFIFSTQGGLSPLHCEGRLIKDEMGKTVFLRGVNKASFEWNIRGVHFVEDDWVNIKSWECNVVRLPFQQDWWMESEEYRARIDQAVAWGEKYGMYTILDNHWTNETYKQDEGRPHDWTTWINMWVDIAERYRHNSSVLFDLWNEPHDSDVFDENEWPTRAQQCVDAIRAVNPDVIILISAMRWGNGDMNWIKTTPINDANIVYTLHWYVHHTPIDDRSVEGIKNWLTTMGWKWILDNDKAPVIVGECNAFEEDEAEWWRNFLSVANEWSMSYLGWAWWPYAGFPPLLKDDGQWKNPNFAGQILIDAILARKVTIKGLITDQNGSPINEAKVTCNGYEALTNESGYYNFTNLETGNYTLKITKGGYVEKTEAVNCPEGGTYTVNVSLEPSGIGTPLILIAVVAIIVAIGLILVVRKWK